MSSHETDETAVRTLAIDTHVHSEGSYDGHEPVDLLLEHAADIGLDGIVVTDHDTIEKSLEAARRASRHGLVGVPGVELSTAHGHLLAIGVEEVPERGLPFEEAVERVRELGGATVVPHPFQRTRHGVRRRHLAECEPEPHALEVYNSMLFTGYRNRRAATFAETYDYPQLGGSDAHFVPNVGRAYTEVDVEADPDTPADEIDVGAVVEAIRKGDTGVRGRRTPIRKSATQYAAGAARKAAYEVTSRMPYVPAWPSGYTSAQPHSQR
ncbi:PHP domain-containing protein [Halospeciosus flavus]|uniref:CehA/McbA family metallohydrolase n=1 Tax=Halospeciosus flavus TaxID=3032283 RepID=A0ABD5Z2K9_9EURY|nr:PHP domain-containing protein [Halospeciosus flavus]